MKIRIQLLSLLFASMGVLLLARWLRPAGAPQKVEDRVEASFQPAVLETNSAPAESMAAGIPGNVRFHWSQIETNDLRAYVARLRASGCPEDTIQDIILGIVNRRYQGRLADLRREARAPFWQTLERRSAGQDQELAKREAALCDLKRERDTLVRDLLGIDFYNYVAGFAEKSDRVTELLGGLAEQNRPEARRVLERYDELERGLVSRVGGTLGVPEQAELEQLYHRKLEELREILTPQELEEFELRTSPLSHRLRTADLVGFSPTEEEFRAIFHLKSALKSQSGPGAQRMSAGDAWRSREQKEQGEAELRQILGEKRFADYRRSQDLTYRRLVEFTGHYGLAAEAAAQVHDVREAVIQQVDRLETDPRLIGATRQTVLHQIQEEAAKTVRESLGEEVYGRYLESQYGRWLGLIPTWTNAVVLRN